MATFVHVKKPEDKLEFVTGVGTTYQKKCPVSSIQYHGDKREIRCFNCGGKMRPK